MKEESQAINIDCSYDDLVNTSKLNPHPKNNNIHPKEQIDRLAKIISYQGFRSAIVVSSLSGFIVKGHGRLIVAKKLGMKKVPVNYQAYENESQEYADLTADNEIARWAELDLDSILNNAHLLSGIDLDVLGIKDLDIPSLDELIPESVKHHENIKKNEESGQEDIIPEVDEKEIVTQLGDIWELGKHRVMCGDSTNEIDIKLLMNGKKADLVFTDPPYNQNTQRGGGTGTLGDALRKQSDKIEWICDFNPNDFLACMPSVFNKNINAYIFCSKDLLPEYLLKARSLGASFWVLIWKKENAIPINSAHRPDIEYLVVMRKKSIFNSGLDGVNYSRVLEYGRDRSGLHPTMKPIGMIENQLFISSNNSSIVVDFFLGSGSTLIACEKTNRKCYGMELDPKYCDVIIKRWQDYTGETAVCINNPEKIIE